jgi:hypothetical protein
VLSFLADVNFNRRVIRGMVRRQSDLDIVRAQEVGLAKAVDPDLLSWAAQEGRVLFTHDVETVPLFAYDRVRAGLPMPGVIEVDQDMSVGQAVEELLIVAECSFPGELEGQILYLPLR